MNKQTIQISPAIHINSDASSLDLTNEIDLLLTEAHALALVISDAGFDEWNDHVRAAYSGAMVRSIDTLKALIQRQRELERAAE